MLSNPILPDYEQLTAVFDKEKLSTHTSEVHGALSGMICAGARMNGKVWLESLLGVLCADTMVSEQSRSILLNLYGETNRQLHGLTFDYQLLLPHDETPLGLRADALGAWCQGFLTGLGLAGFQITPDITDEVRDALHHLTEIARLDFEQVQINERDEMAFDSVAEYVRMSVLTIAMELTESKIKPEEMVYH